MSRIRVTGGQWRSRLIQVIDAPGLRPTPDRVRETLFNWLGHDLSGWSCLDLFAGTGILGIEAASRGASAVDFVERDGKARALLLKHLSAFAPDVSKGSTRLQVHGMDALNFTPLEPVDLLFLDPPYRQGLLDRVSPRLPLLIKPSGCLYVEAEHRLSNFGSWRVVKQGQSGQVFFHLLEQS
ncbi:MAG: 16S rRNA (guanine(966)-N(2))-methyltransferase RsmD [Rhodocyclaceae bacterium]|jgi:16S rRNA (guanine966-N2)-methyltransferase|nr:16S rRNA (guanine(966)-N(2))-methyltransferase RsmD [Rhodocyclaceae bacterium]